MNYLATFILGIVSLVKIKTTAVEKPLCPITWDTEKITKQFLDQNYNAQKFSYFEVNSSITLVYKTDIDLIFSIAIAKKSKTVEYVTFEVPSNTRSGLEFYFEKSVEYHNVVYETKFETVYALRRELSFSLIIKRVSASTQIAIGLPDSENWRCLEIEGPERVIVDFYRVMKPYTTYFRRENKKPLFIGVDLVVKVTIVSCGNANIVFGTVLASFFTLKENINSFMSESEVLYKIQDVLIYLSRCSNNQSVQIKTAEDIQLGIKLMVKSRTFKLPNIRLKGFSVMRKVNLQFYNQMSEYRTENYANNPVFILENNGEKFYFFFTPNKLSFLKPPFTNYLVYAVVNMYFSKGGTEFHSEQFYISNIVADNRLVFPTSASLKSKLIDSVEFVFEMCFNRTKTELYVSLQISEQSKFRLVETLNIKKVDPLFMELYLLQQEKSLSRAFHQMAGFCLVSDFFLENSIKSWLASGLLSDKERIPKLQTGSFLETEVSETPKLKELLKAESVKFSTESIEQIESANKKALNALNENLKLVETEKELVLEEMHTLKIAKRNLVAEKEALKQELAEERSKKEETSKIMESFAKSFKKVEQNVSQLNEKLVESNRKIHNSVTEISKLEVNISKCSEKLQELENIDESYSQEDVSQSTDKGQMTKEKSNLITTKQLLFYILSLIVVAVFSFLLTLFLIKLNK